MTFDVNLEMVNHIAKITMAGELDASVAEQFKGKIEEAVEQEARRVVLIVDGLEYMSSAGLRILVFAKQKMDTSVEIFVVGAKPNILLPIKQTGLHHSLTLLDTYDAEIIDNL